MHFSDVCARSLNRCEVILVKTRYPTSYHRLIHRKRLQPREGLAVYTVCASANCKVGVKFLDEVKDRIHLQFRSSVVQMRLHQSIAAVNDRSKKCFFVGLLFQLLDSGYCYCAGIPVQHKEASSFGAANAVASTNACFTE